MRSVVRTPAGSLDDPSGLHTICIWRVFDRHPICHVTEVTEVTMVAEAAEVTMIATAPGKLILTGEYAVLDGAPALVIAVDRRVVATRGGA